MSSICDMDDDDGDASSHCLSALKFADDFAEFQARADSGGSAYGVLKRHAFAQQSLRVVAPADRDVDVVVPQRRANSLVPPTISQPDADAAGDTADQKMIIAVLCDQSAQQKRRHRYHHHHDPHSDEEVEEDDLDIRHRQRHRERRKSDLYLYKVEDKGAHKVHDRHHHHHPHKQQHYHQSNQQPRQQSEPSSIKMDTLQVGAYTVWQLPS